MMFVVGVFVLKWTCHTSYSTPTHLPSLPPFLPFSLPPSLPQRYGYLTAANNRMYACKHGYAFVFAYIKNAEEEGNEDEEDPDKYLKGCRGQEGMRSAPWCKVYVLARVLRMYERVIFLDSDATVANMTMPVEGWLDTYEEEGGTEGERGGRRDEGERPLYVSDDRPFREDRMNTGTLLRGGGEGGKVHKGIQCEHDISPHPPHPSLLPPGLMIAYSSSSSTHSFLKQWWETDPGRWGRTSPFEQEVLNEAKEGGMVGWRESTARLVVAPALQGPYDEKTKLVVAGFGILNPENQPM